MESLKRKRMGTYGKHIAICDFWKDSKTSLTLVDALCPSGSLLGKDFHIDLSVEIHPVDH